MYPGTGTRVPPSNENPDDHLIIQRLIISTDLFTAEAEALFFVLDKLHERQRDPDERVRQEVVATICDAASENISCISDQV